MASLSKCPGCGLVLAAAAAPALPTMVELAVEPDPADIVVVDALRPRPRQQTKAAEALRQVVSRYATHNDELERSLRAANVGGRVFGAVRFNDG